MRQKLLPASLAVSRLGLALASLVASGCVDRADVGSFGADAGAPLEGGAGSADGGDGGPPTASVTTATTRIAASGDATCAVDAKGGVKCWGNNQHGTLGTGSFVPGESIAPVGARGLGSGVVAVAGGAYTQCAILANGTARCWGRSLFGEIAGPGTFESVATADPHDKMGLANDVAEITFGTGFGCALTTRGRAKCWGSGGAGQLGTGTTDDQLVARDIAGLDEPVVHVSAAFGGLSACAVTASKKVVCWGANTEGQLGTSSPKTALPTYVEELEPDVARVATGNAHACALYENGTVACWGDDTHAQLGRGAKGPSRRAQKIPGVEGAKQIAAGAVHTCALLGDARVVCWGENVAGEVASPPGVRAPTETFAAAFGAVSVALGFTHTCAISAAGVVKCVGATTRKQTGAGEFSL
ncbi:MAG: hypothetical protein JST00_23685 [Deltaproteobacteria bacterium]|nr:hypothetical protein [Deltaproteobacteria bacterium]